MKNNFPTCFVYNFAAIVLKTFWTFRIFACSKNFSNFQSCILPPVRFCLFILSERALYIRVTSDRSLTFSCFSANLFRPCAAGRYCNEQGLTNATKLCDPGYYCPGGASSPTPKVSACATGSTPPPRRGWCCSETRIRQLVYEIPAIHFHPVWRLVNNPSRGTTLFLHPALTWIEVWQLFACETGSKLAHQCKNLSSWYWSIVACCIWDMWSSEESCQEMVYQFK